MPRIWMFVLLTLILAAACSPTGTAPDQNADTAPRIDWNRDPDAVIVRLDSNGSSGDRASDLNALPLCTLFGDGHIVWVNAAANPEEVLEDRLDEAAMLAFIESIVNAGFYQWEPQHIGLAETTRTGALRERILLELFEEPHTVQADATWPPNAYRDILDRCRQLSSTPVLVVPSGVWVSAVPDASDSAPRLSWASYRDVFDGVRLADLTLENPRWVTGEAAAQAWALARRGRVLLSDGGETYRLVAQVPVLQPNAPDAPQ